MDRSTFLYIGPKSGDKTGQCASCKMWLKDHKLCSLHGKNVKIEATMSCGLWVTGGPAKESEMEHVSAAVTPKESGLVNKQVRCINCEYFKKDENECLLFEILGIEDHTVDANGCCNAFHSDEGEEKKESKQATLKRFIK